MSLTPSGLSPRKNCGSISLFADKTGSVSLETGITKHLNALMFRILSRHLKQRTVGSYFNNVHFMAQGGEAQRYLFLRMNKRTGENLTRFG